MKRLTLIIGLFLVIGLVAGCAGKSEITEPAPEDTTADAAADSEVDAELDGTFVADEDLDVGEII